MQNKFKTIIWAVIFLSNIALGYDKLDFSARINEMRIDFTQKGCVAFLDDDSNFEVEKVPGISSFVIRTKAASERSAMLVIDCGAESFFYSLAFIANDKSLWTEKMGANRFNRINSQVTVRSAFDADKPNLDFELIDKSLDLFQYEVRSGSPGYSDLLNNYNKSGSKSLDIIHKFDEGKIFGYGFSKNVEPNWETNVFRSNFEYWGILYTGMYSRNTLAQSEYWNSLTMPAPVQLRLSYAKRKNNNLVKKIGRTFNLTGNTLGFTFAWDTEGETIPHNSTLYKTNFSSQLSYYGLVWTRPKLNLDSDCVTLSTCILRRVKFTSDYKLNNYETIIAYGPIPNELELNAQMLFRGRNRIKATFNKGFARASSLINEKYFSAPEDARPLIGTLSAQYEREDIQNLVTLFNLDIPFLPWSNLNTSTLRTSINYETQKYIARSLIGISPFSKSNLWSLQGQFSYYFDNNIKYFVDSSGKHEIKGTVVSNIIQSPLENATVRLENLAGEIISVTSTDEGGHFSFANVPKEGSFNIIAKYEGFETKYEVKKIPVNPVFDCKVEIQDHVRVKIRFYIDTDKSNSLTPKDTIVFLDNYFPEIDEGFLMAADTPATKDTLVLKRNTKVELKIQKAFLPLDYTLIKVYNNPVDTFQEGELYVDVLLLQKH